jgi:hypothetical protein
LDLSTQGSNLPYSQNPWAQTLTPWVQTLTPYFSIPSGGDVVVLYASIYGDVPMVINLSGRFDLKKGLEERLGKEFMDRINKEGFYRCN